MGSLFSGDYLKENSLYFTKIGQLVRILEKKLSTHGLNL